MSKISNSITRLFARDNSRPPMYRRLQFAVLVLITQMLLIALTVAWLIHMVIIAMNGLVYFVEQNPFILWGEIGLTILIMFFATGVLVLQVQRLGERRRDTDSKEHDR